MRLFVAVEALEPVKDALENAARALKKRRSPAISPAGKIIT